MIKWWMIEAINAQYTCTPLFTQDKRVPLQRPFSWFRVLCFTGVNCSHVGD
jgi:hypothetical protein